MIINNCKNMLVANKVASEPVKDVVKESVYTKEKKLGKGAYGCVYKAKDKNNKYVALKELECIEDAKGTISSLREYETLRMLAPCDFCVKLVDVTFDVKPK